MKITCDDQSVIYRYLNRVMANVKPQQAEDHYHKKGLRPKRLRWDLFHQANKLCVAENGKPLIGDGIGMDGMTTIYAYANDDHIDTLLRRFCKGVGMHWASKLEAKA